MGTGLDKFYSIDKNYGINSLSANTYFFRKNDFRLLKVLYFYTAHCNEIPLVKTMIILLT